MKLSSIYKSTVKIALVIIIIFTAGACRKEILQVTPPENNPNLTYEQFFDSYWTGMNNNYVFWDIDPTDWDQVYKKYKPLFARMDKNPEDINKIYTYFKEMTSQLVDGHYAIEFRDSTFISPPFNRHKNSADYHSSISDNFFQKTIPAKYLQKGTISIAQTNAGTKDMFFIVTGKTDQNILYLYFNHFLLKKKYEQDKDVKKVFDNFLEQIKNQNDLKGVIIDVRNNGGGETRDLNFLMGHLTDKQYTFGSTRGKAGMGRLEFSGWTPLRVSPAPDAKNFTKPIVILADINSVSMSEITTLAIKALPGGNGTFVGERTWGGQGPRGRSLDFNSGPFKLARFVKEITMAAIQVRDNNGKVYEGVGISPDIEVKYNAAAMAADKDPQLEKAISIIR